MKYFIDELSIFQSLMNKKLTFEDISSDQSRLFLGFCKDVIYSDSAVPSFVMAHNVEKPKYSDPESDYVDMVCLDAAVSEQWIKFRQLIREANNSGKVIFTDGKNYPAKARDLLHQEGCEVFMGGLWRDLRELKYLEE